MQYTRKFYSCTVLLLEVKAKRARKMFTGYFCAFPLHSHVPGISLMRCAKVCMETPGCYSFNYRKSADGACAVIAPSGGHSLNYHPTVEAEWHFYEMTEEWI